MAKLKKLVPSLKILQAGESEEGTRRKDKTIINLGRASSDIQVSKQMHIHLDMDVQVREIAQNKKNELMEENKTLELLRRRHGSRVMP